MSEGKLQIGYTWGNSWIATSLSDPLHFIHYEGWVLIYMWLLIVVQYTLFYTEWITIIILVKEP